MGQPVKRIIPTMIPAFYSNSKVPLQGKRQHQEPPKYMGWWRIFILFLLIASPWKVWNINSCHEQGFMKPQLMDKVQKFLQIAGLPCQPRNPNCRQLPWPSSVVWGVKSQNSTKTGTFLCRLALVLPPPSSSSSRGRGAGQGLEGRAEQGGEGGTCSGLSLGVWGSRGVCGCPSRSLGGWQLLEKLRGERKQRAGLWCE